MKTKLLETVKKYSMFSQGENVVVGLSGGADSMCLISLLQDVKDDLKIGLSAVHINHCIRGDEGDRDEQFVRAFCKEKDIPLTVFRRDIPEIAAETGESIELAARRVRYECFRSLGADKIATAHSASDRIETFLFNLSRGASLKGLCSIPPVRDTIVRPLIDFTRTEIEEYCTLNSISYVTDSTNLTDEYTRNKYRLKVIPELTSINPAFEKNALRCIELLNVENAYIEDTAEGMLNKYLADGRLQISELLSADECIFRRVVIMFLESNCINEYEYSHINIITENKGKRFSVCFPGNSRIESDGRYIFVNNISPCVCAEPLKEYSFNKKDGITFENGNKRYEAYISDAIPDEIGIFAADADKTEELLVFRSRQAGDVIRPGKGRCRKPLRKLFNELKIPADEREYKYVLADEKGVVFAEDIGFDASRLCDNNTDKYLIIKTEEI